MTTWTHEDLDQLTWHDCSIWGLELRATGVEDEGTSDLALDIDFIVEWLCGVDGPAQFRVAPATLVFHGVTDLRVLIECSYAGSYQMAPYPAQIDRIERRRIEDQRVFLDRPYYAWTIPLNMPTPGVIEFGAYGFTQTLRTEPVLTKSQQLPYRRRST